MKPEVLVYAASQSANVMAQLEQYFECHHLWQQPVAERAAWLEGVAGKVRAVLTTGGIGITAAQLAQLPKVEIVAVNGIGTDAVDLDACRARDVAVTNTPGVLTDDVADLALTLLLSAARRTPALDFTCVPGRGRRASRWRRAPCAAKCAASTALAPSARR
jgi:lactate dehydrogenase-like 2-hydroxyacid dehydrogenase